MTLLGISCIFKSADIKKQLPRQCRMRGGQKGRAGWSAGSTGDQRCDMIGMDLYTVSDLQGVHSANFVLEHHVDQQYWSEIICGLIQFASLPVTQVT